MSTQPAIFTDKEVKDWLDKSFDQYKWREEGNALIQEHDYKQWKLGEWVDQGVGALTRKVALKEAMLITGYAQTTLWDFGRTARVFSDSPEDPNSRRRDLSWSHHKEVAIADLSPEKRCELLDSAEESNWSIQELRTHVKDALKKQHGETTDDKLLPLQVLVNKSTRKFLTQAAKKEGIARAEFAGNLLDKKCRKPNRKRKA
jgi:hypothetical protein